MPMPQKLLCPHCRLALTLEEARGGTPATCPFCDGKFLVPKPPIPERTDTQPPPTAEVPFFVPPAAEARAEPADTRPPLSGPPPIPQFRVVQEDEEYDPVSARRRRASRHRDSEYGSEELLPEPEPMSRKEANQWQTVQTGLALLQFGYILSLLSALALVVLVGPFQPPSASSPFGPGYSAPGVQPLLCGSGGCLIVGLVLLVIGQAMLCAAPHPGARSTGITSLVLLLSGGLLTAVNIASSASRIAPVAGNRVTLSMQDILTLLAVLALASSHIVFVVFLQTLAQHFRDVSARRQAIYYLVFYLVYLIVSSIAAAIAYPQQATTPSTYNSSRSGDLSALTALCWGCFGIFLLIALISIVQQARSVLRDRLQFGRRRRAEQRDLPPR